MAYLRFSLMTLLLLAAIAGFALGGAWMLTAFVFNGGIVVLLDGLVGEDARPTEQLSPRLLNLLLFGTLPLVLCLGLTIWWMAGRGDGLHLSRVLHALTGRDPFAARAATKGWHWILAVLGCGLVTAGSATTVGHELSHRTRSPLSVAWGRWMLAFSCDAVFSVEHVYGHHAKLCTPQDPASARRGETVFGFVPRSTVGQWRGAWELERKRLARQGQALWGWRNLVLRGWLMSAALAGLAFAAGGWRGTLVFLASAAIAKTFLEATNFLEHYGLVRVPGARVEPRHSWNSNAAMSSWVLYNLTRHSDHHAEGSKPFWRLRALPEAPCLPFGYMTMILVASVPPCYERLMRPRLRRWDADHASEAERELARSEDLAAGWA